MSPIELSYWDKCDIYELEKAKDKNKITKQDWVLKYQDIDCALSKNKLPSSTQTDSENVIAGDFTIFINDKVLIKAGSKIICKGYDLRAGKPFIYEDSHQEVPVYLEERA